MRLAPLLVVLAPGPLAAHPHVFVEATVEVLAERGAVTAVRLVWTYDDLFSLVLTEDLGLDADGDMALTDAEAATLRASVADWPPDFAGDLVVTGQGAPLALGPREDHGVSLDGGRVVEAHRRPLAAPAPGAVTIEVYDPGYYVAYSITAATVTGDPACTATVIPADLDAAQAEVDGLWAGLDVAGADAGVELPPVGYAFSDRVVVRCG